MTDEYAGLNVDAKATDADIAAGNDDKWVSGKKLIATSYTKAETDSKVGAAVAASPILWDVDLPLRETMVRKLEGDLSFERNSPTTTINKSGVVEDVKENFPAITKDGMSCYEAVPNLLIYSEDFSNGAWSTANNASIVSENHTDPKGGSNATLVDLPESAAQLRQNVPITNDVIGNVHTLSFYVKPVTLTRLRFRPDASDIVSQGVTYDFSTNEWEIPNGPSVEAGQAIKLNDGWYRLSVKKISFYEPLTYIYARIQAESVGAGTAYIWGGNLTPTSFPAPYIPTTDQPVTREADICSIPMEGNMPPAGEPFTIVIDCAGVLEDAKALFAFDSVRNRIVIDHDLSKRIVFRLNDGSNESRSLVVEPFDTGNEPHRYVGVSSPSMMYLYIDGVLIGELSKVGNTYDVNDVLVFGNNLASTAPEILNSEIRNFHIIHRALSDSEILALGGPQ